MKNSRIEILDGFRAVAILAVMFFHFFSRWAPQSNSYSLYPYNNQYDFFRYGYLGVQFFFMISGFVIFFTLERTNEFSVFLKKRLIRLFPSIVVATIITYLVFNLLDNSFVFPEAHEIKNFIPSLSFISPSFFNQLFGTEYKYINGSYWSLWPEVQFYIFISIIYYLNKAKAVRNFISISILLILVNYAYTYVQDNNGLYITLPQEVLDFYFVWMGIFNLIDYLPCFSLGVLFYILYKDKQLNQKSLIWIKASVFFFMTYTLYLSPPWDSKIIYAVIFSLFLCFIYLPGGLFVFKNNFLVRIGKGSYFLYLIHESIGVLLIYLFAQYFFPVSFLFILLLIYAFIWISFFYTEKIDYYISRFLKKRLLSEK